MLQRLLKQTRLAQPAPEAEFLVPAQSGQLLRVQQCLADSLQEAKSVAEAEMNAAPVSASAAQVRCVMQELLRCACAFCPWLHLQQ